MAYVFVDKPAATFKIRSADGNEKFTVGGVKAQNATLAQVKEGVDLLLDIAGKETMIDEYTQRVVTEGVEMQP